MQIQNIINKFFENKKILQSDLDFIFSGIIDSKFNEHTAAAILTLLSNKGFDEESLLSVVNFLRSKCNKLLISSDTIDTCGTGGDGKHTLNISTASAIVLSALGTKVVKHGNKSVTSKCGSADVLEALGYNIHKTTDELIKDIDNKNFVFLFAPNFHPAMKNVANLRKSLPFRTIFNLVGPLINPTFTQRQIIGVYDKKYLNVYISVLKKLHYKRAWVFHSNEGLDEISIFNKTSIIELNKGKIKRFIIDPKKFIKKKYSINDIVGSDANYNARMLHNIFKGNENAFSEIVSLNAAAGLIVAEKYENLQEAFIEVKNFVKSGKVYNHLQKILS